MTPVDTAKYRLADCTLFRTPPVDFSPIEAAVEKALLEAWERGHNAQQAVSSISSSEGLIAKIAAQIAESLSFQRKQATEKVKADVNVAVQGYEQQKSAQIGQLDSYFGGVLAEKSRALESATSGLAESRRAYDAVQSSLMRIRNNVDARLDKIGGAQGYNALAEIREKIVRDYAGASSGALSGRIQQAGQKVAELHAPQTQMQPGPPSSLEQAVQPGEALSEKSAPEPALEKKNLVQKAVLAVWNVFEKGYNYLRQ